MLWVHDEFPAGGIQFVEGEGFYAGEELQLIATFAWPDGGPHSLIDDQYRGYSEQDFADRNLRYLAPGAGLENCQAELILRRNPDAGSDLNVLAHYYYYKFIRGEEVLQGYLKGNQRLTLVYLQADRGSAGGGMSVGGRSGRQLFCESTTPRPGCCVFCKGQVLDLSACAGRYETTLMPILCILNRERNGAVTAKRECTHSIMNYVVICVKKVI